MAAQRIHRFTISRSVVVALCSAAIVVILMALLVADYLVDTYSHASPAVGVLASLIVAIAVAVPYWQAQRMCARKAQRAAQDNRRSQSTQRSASVDG
jgi:membrane protein CcdC involved in cytochrome C biogenesis